MPSTTLSINIFNSTVTSDLLTRRLAEAKNFRERLPRLIHRAAEKGSSRKPSFRHTQFSETPRHKKRIGATEPRSSLSPYKSYWNKVLLERLTDEQTACNQHYARAEYPEGRGAASRTGEYTP